MSTIPLVMQCAILFKGIRATYLKQDLAKEGYRPQHTLQQP